MPLVPGAKFFYVKASAVTKNQKGNGKTKAEEGFPLPLKYAIDCFQEAHGNLNTFKREWNALVKSDQVFIRKKDLDVKMPKGKYRWNIRRMHESTRKSANRRGVDRLTRLQLVVRCRAMYKLIRILGTRFYRDLLRQDPDIEGLDYILDQNPNEIPADMEADMEAEDDIDVVNETDRWVYFSDQAYADIIEQPFKSVRWPAGAQSYVTKANTGKLQLRSAGNLPKFAGQPIAGGSSFEFDSDNPFAMEVIHGGTLNEDTDSDSEIEEVHTDASSDDADDDDDNDDDTNSTSTSSTSTTSTSTSSSSSSSDDDASSDFGSDDDASELMGGDITVPGSTQDLMNLLWKNHKIVVSRCRDNSHVGIFRADEDGVKIIGELSAEFDVPSNTVKITSSSSLNPEVEVLSALIAMEPFADKAPFKTDLHSLPTVEDYRKSIELVVPVSTSSTSTSSTSTSSTASTRSTRTSSISSDASFTKQYSEIYSKLSEIEGII